MLKFTITLADAPGARLPNPCGSGVPFVAPNFAVVNVTSLAGREPMFCTVIAPTTVEASARLSAELTTSLTKLQGVGPAVKLKLTVPRLVAPSCNCSVAVIVWPEVRLPSAVKEKSRATQLLAAIAP